MEIKLTISLSYEFLKLYAMNYICYHKKVADCYSVWVWKKGRYVEVKDWYDQTFLVVLFYLKNRDNVEGEYLHAMWNRDKRELLVKDYSKLWKKNRLGKTVYTDYYKDYEEIGFHRESMDELVEELKLISNLNELLKEEKHGNY